MSLERIVRIEMHCTLGPGNDFTFKGVMADSFEVLASGSARQHIELFRNLLKKLGEVYNEDDSMVVEVQNGIITGVR